MRAKKFVRFIENATSVSTRRSRATGYPWSRHRTICVGPVNAPATGVSAEEFLPKGPHPGLEVLAESAAHCRGCDLWESATQTVFGAGAARAKVVLVGEQPGDSEDRSGKPFVGPAGSLLDDALEEAGIDRAETYVTNAVKHFKWEPRGKRRIHKTPNQYEITACRPWLQAELLALSPDLVVAMGSTAARAVLGRPVKILQVRGTVIDDARPPVGLTVHPSSILRSRDSESRRIAFEEFVRDLRSISQVKIAA